MFETKTWKDRVVEYPNRRVLLDENTSDQQIVTVSRSEGTITEPGDPFSAENMNGLESRISTETNKLEADIANVQNGDTTTRSFAVDDYYIHNGILYRVITAIPAGGAMTTSNSVQVAVMDELKAAKTNIASIQSQVNGISSVVSGMARVVTIQQELGLDTDGKTQVITNLSPYKAGTEAYIPVTITGIATLEGFAVSITNATLSTYTVEIRRLTGTITNPRVLISYYIM